MATRKKKIDGVRLLAVAAVAAGIAHFYLTFFAPGLIPYQMRPGVPGRHMNILLMGSDIVYDTQTHRTISRIGHSDTMMLVNVGSGRISILSVPRDTLADIPGYGKSKINAATYIGGPELAVRTVEGLLNVDIDAYVIVNPSVVTKLIDSIGGVDLYADKDMYYVDNAAGLHINLRKGWHHLSGKEAAGYLRYRMDPLGDINRTQRQQGFISAVIRRMATPQNIWRLPLLTGIVKESVQTDLSLKDMLRIGLLARGLPRESFSTMLLPGSFSTESDKPCFWIPNMQDTEKMVRKYFGGKSSSGVPSGSGPAAYYVSILNNTGESGIVPPLLRKLANRRYIISSITMVRRDDFRRTAVLCQKGDLKDGEALGSLLGIKNVINSSAGDITSDFTIVLCKDINDKNDK